MTNKSLTITMSLLRIGVLAAQIAVSPSAAVQCRDFRVGEGDRLVALVRGLTYLGNDDIAYVLEAVRRCASKG